MLNPNIFETSFVTDSNDEILLSLLVIMHSFNWSHASTDSILIHLHLEKIISNAYRTHSDTSALNKTADYIESVFKKYSDSVSIQAFTVNGVEYKNIICSFGTKQTNRVIVGAHYDVCGKQDGADDNASGVVGLLELARQLKDKDLKYRVDLVAYTLEEPPFFKTENMGSFIHAKWLRKNNINVYGMVSLEMIGYFKDEKNSQKYPVGLLKWFYGSRGDYITMVSKLGARRFCKHFIHCFKSVETIRTKKFTAPARLPGIDFSDHLNYWKFGYKAMMITDTSFYRNPNYHERSDTIDTLDIGRMCKVIDGVFNALVTL